MPDFLRSLLLSRGVQIVAKFFAFLFAFAAGKLGVSVPEAQANEGANALALLAVAGVCLLADLFIHWYRGKNATKPAGSNSGFSATLLLFCLLPLATLTGCLGTKPPAGVNEARNLKREALQSYAANNEKIVEAILQSSATEAYAHIDARFEADLAEARRRAEALGGKVDVNLAIEGMKKLVAERDAARKRVDEEVEKIRGIVAQAQVDLAITMKLDEVLERYENAGIDVSIARGAAEQILGLVKARKQK